METQSYAKHTKLVPGFHVVLFGLLVLSLIGAGVNLFHSFGDHERLYSASLIFVIVIAMLLLFFFTRQFATGNQDRTVRAEENLRHLAMTGKLLDPALTRAQVIALRFASDGEFVALAARAAKEGMSADDIKKAVKTWRADNHRV